MPLISSTPTLSRPTVGRLDVEHDARHRRAHDREVDEVLGVGADRRADVEHDRFAAQRRPHRRDRRAFDQRHRAQADFGHRHQRAGVAGRNRAIGLAFLDRVDRLPHRGGAPPRTQRLARLVRHLDRDFAVDDARLALERRIRGQQRRDRLLVAEQNEIDVGPALERDRRRVQHDRGPVVAAHRVERYANVLFHPNFYPEGAP